MPFTTVKLSEVSVMMKTLNVRVAEVAETSGIVKTSNRDVLVKT
jgi:hypothetical protein